jgi:hypothetical protein
MEARKITVVSTRNQKKSVIMSAATTLAELKADLRQNGIDYDGMTFYEGTSKVELKDDASVLPHDVLYKGQTTNELVFMLTNTNKKIRSGADMSRADAYAAIKANGLQGECVKRFGKNFTMCKTADLIALVNEKSASKPAPAAPAKETPAKEEEVAETKKEEAKEQAGTAECVDTKARAALSRLLTILTDNGTLEDDEAEEIEDILGGKVEVAASEDYKPSSASPYSDDEIDRMFDFAR